MRLRDFLHLFSLIAVLSGLACSPAGRGPGQQPPGDDPGPEVTPAVPRGRGALAYGPVSRGRYRLDSRDSIAMEMPDGLVQRTVTVKTAFLTMNFQPRGESYAGEIVLDSVVLDRPNPILQPLADSARGTRWQAVLRTSGRLDSVVVSRPSVFGEQVRALLQRLLPVLPDSGAAPGDRWQDQTTRPYQIMPGFEAEETRSANYRAGKWEEEDGLRVMPIRSSMTYTVTGSGAGFGQEIRFDGGGEAEGMHWLTPAGTLNGAQVTDSVRLTLTVPAVGQSVPTTVVTSYSLRVIP